MEVEEQVRAVRELEAALPLDTRGVERLELLEERRHVDDGAVPKKVLRVRVDDAAGQQVEGKLVPVRDDGVSGVRPAVETSDEVVAVRQGETV